LSHVDILVSVPIVWKLWQTCPDMPHLQNTDRERSACWNTDSECYAYQSSSLFVVSTFARNEDCLVRMTYCCIMYKMIRT